MMPVYSLCLVFLLIGIYCVAVKQNLVKIIIGLIIMEYAAILFLTVFGLGSKGMDGGLQALSATIAAAGLATTILMASIAMRIYERYGTFDIAKIRKLKG